MSFFTIIYKASPNRFHLLWNRIKSAPIGTKIVGGMFWSVLGIGSAKVWSFLAMILVARILGKEAFGEFGMVRSTALTFLEISSFGIGVTSMKCIAEFLRSDKERTSRLIGLSYWFAIFSSVVITSGFYLFIPTLCEQWLKTPHLIQEMRFGTALLFLSIFMSVQSCMLKGFQDFRSLALTSFSCGFLTVPLFICGAYYGGVAGTLVGSIASVFLNALLNGVFIHRNIKRHQLSYSMGQAYKESSLLWHSNLPQTLAFLVYGLSPWLVQTTLASRPDGMSQLGIYYAAAGLQTIMLFLPQLFLSVLLPVFSQLNGANDRNRFWKTVKVSVYACVGLLIVSIAPFLLFPSWFMGLNGVEFAGDGHVLFTAALAASGIIASGFTSQVVISHGKNWLHLFLVMVSSGLFLALFLGMPSRFSGASSVFTCFAISQFVYVFSVLIIYPKRGHVL